MLKSKKRSGKQTHNNRNRKCRLFSWRCTHIKYHFFSMWMLFWLCTREMWESPFRIDAAYGFPTSFCRLRATSLLFLNNYSRTNCFAHWNNCCCLFGLKEVTKRFITLVRLFVVVLFNRTMNEKYRTPKKNGQPTPFNSPAAPKFKTIIIYYCVKSQTYLLLFALYGFAYAPVSFPPEMKTLQPTTTIVDIPALTFRSLRYWFAFLFVCWSRH